MFFCLFTEMYCIPNYGICDFFSSQRNIIGKIGIRESMDLAKRVGGGIQQAFWIFLNYGSIDDKNFFKNCRQNLIIFYCRLF